MSTARVTFGLIEEALVRLYLLPILDLRILDHPDDAMYPGQIVHLEDPTMEVINHESVARCNVYVLANDEVKLQWYNLTELKNLLTRCFREISQVREYVARRAHEMTRFVEENVSDVQHPFTNPDEFYRNRQERFMIHIKPVMWVTHLRLRIECINQDWERKLHVSISPAFGDTVANWEALKWRVDDWSPSPQQRLHSDKPLDFDLKQNLSTIIFNVLDGGNRALVPGVQFIRSSKRAKLMVLSGLNVHHNEMAPICSKMGFRRKTGVCFDPRFGGLWLLWDDRCINLHVIRDYDNIIEAVAVDVDAGRD